MTNEEMNLLGYVVMRKIKYGFNSRTDWQLDFSRKKVYPSEEKANEAIVHFKRNHPEDEYQVQPCYINNIP